MGDYSSFLSDRFHSLKACLDGETSVSAGEGGEEGGIEGREGRFAYHAAIHTGLSSGQLIGPVNPKVGRNSYLFLSYTLSSLRSSYCAPNHCAVLYITNAHRLAPSQGTTSFGGGVLRKACTHIISGCLR